MGKKKFTAYGVLYTAGDTIGLTDKTLSDDLMRRLVINSPLKVPVLSELGKAISGNPDYVIGNAILMYQDVSALGKEARLAVKVTFNEQHRKEYETILNSGKARNRLHFGFLLSSVKHDDKGEIVDGKITAVSLNGNGLGGEVISYGWEDEAND